MAHRPERLAESMREELTDLIGGELADPRIGLASVTEVKIAPGLRVAHVFVAVTGDAAEQERSLHALIGARGYLRSQLAVRLNVRQVPDLRFELDRSEELSAQLNRLLTRAHKRAAAVTRRATPAESIPPEGDRNHE